MTLLNKSSRNNRLRLLGAIYGKKAFAPPKEVEIILHDKCNLNCAVCWFHSDFIKENVFPELTKNEQDPKVLTKLICELADLGVETIIFNANGEPFLYSSLIKLVKLVKEKGMKCRIITNGTLIDNSIINKLSKSGLDWLRVSLWAGDAATYINVHPNQTEKTFYKIKKWMLYLKRMKERNNSIYPRLLITNVMFNKNYRTIPKMVSFAQEVGAYHVDFMLAQLFAPGLKRFSLSKRQKMNTVHILDKLKPNLITVNSNLTEFKKQASYNWKGVQRMDRGLTLRIPCYVGWYFSRISSNGDIIPCSGCYLKPAGNIYKQPFKEAWFSKGYNKFREHAKNNLKGQYFKDCLCNKDCCHYLLNLSIYEKIYHLKHLFIS